MPSTYSLNVGHAELLGQPQDVVLGRPDEGAAGLDHAAGLEVVVEHPAADAVARLDERAPSGRDGPTAGGHQAGDPAADHDDVDRPGEPCSPRPGRERTGAEPGHESPAPCRVRRVRFRSSCLQRASPIG